MQIDVLDFTQETIANLINISRRIQIVIRVFGLGDTTFLLFLLLLSADQQENVVVSVAEM